MKKLLMIVGICLGPALCGCLARCVFGSRVVCVESVCGACEVRAGGGDTVSPACSVGTERTGFMRVRVADGMTDEPICGAAVVVPEAGLTCATDADGLTDLMELPCVADPALDALCPIDEGRVTVLVYAEGYVPYLLLYARVLPGAERETPTVYMFADDGSLPVFEVIEAPPMEWAAEVAERYRP